MYKNYIFDLYGTLVDIHTEEESRELWTKLAVFYGYYGASYTPEELKVAYRKEEANMRMKALKQAHVEAPEAKEYYPEIVLEYVFQKMFLRRGVNASLELSIHAGQFFRTLSMKYIKLYKGVSNMLRKLKESGSHVYLLSNAQRIFTQYEMTLLDITQYFDGILFSSDAGYMKPDRHFYEKLFCEYDINPKESIMTGNDYRCDVLGAKAVGLDTCYVHSNLSPELDGKVESTYVLMQMDIGKMTDVLMEK